jgi:hypothetical protein
MQWRIRKWYLDVVDPSGCAAIAYWAYLQAGPAQFTASSLLTAEPGRAPQTTTTMLGSREPAERNGSIAWVDTHSQSHGQWTGQTFTQTHTLYSQANGCASWRCVMPSGAATLRWPGGLVQGLGYAELLELTLPPWQLPIDELRWGRVCTPGTPVAWINWRGTHPLTLVLVDGVGVPDATVADDHINAGETMVHLGEQRVLRSGPIGTTALAGLPLLGRLAQAQWLASHERKWLAQADVQHHNNPPVKAWAVHEKVDFTGT